MKKVYAGDYCVSIKNLPQDMGGGCRDKNHHLVVCIRGRKVQLMYQQREKFSSLNLLMTSSAKRYWQL